jgi:hypothetical protein
MQGDYYRYITEFTTGEANAKAGDNAQTAYKTANDLAEK